MGVLFWECCVNPWKVNQTLQHCFAQLVADMNELTSSGSTMGKHVLVTSVKGAFDAMYLHL